MKVAFGDEETELARTIYRKHMQLNPSELEIDPHVLISRVSEEAERSLESLSKTGALLKIITGPESKVVLSAAVSDLEPGDLGLLSREYTVNPNISGWLSAFLGMAQARSTG